VIPGAPDEMRRELLELWRVLKDKNVAFLTDSMEPQEQSADKSLIVEVRELKEVAQELLKSDNHADADITEVIEQPEELTK